MQVFHLVLAQIVNAPRVNLEATNINNKQVVTITVGPSERTTFVQTGPVPDPMTALTAFMSYKWESEAHVEWVRKLAADLRSRGIDAKLDQWEVRFGESFTDYMQTHINAADVILFVITPDSVAAAEAPAGAGGALKFEVQMMNARRMAEGVRIIGVYRSGDRPPHYLRDHRYIDFRDDTRYEDAVAALVADLRGQSGPPPIATAPPHRGASLAVAAWADPSNDWSSRHVTSQETNRAIDLEYPEFDGRALGASTASVNRRIRSFVDDLWKRFMNEIKGPGEVPVEYQLDSSFVVTLLRPAVVSVKFSMHSFTGGAHGAQWTEVFNYLPGQERAFGIADLFTDLNAGIASLSAYAVAQLIRDRDARNADWVRRGAGPVPENFRALNLTRIGILLTFDEYQVGSYAEGASEVLVPYEVLMPALNPDIAKAVTREPNR